MMIAMRVCLRQQNRITKKIPYFNQSIYTHYYSVYHIHVYTYIYMSAHFFVFVLQRSDGMEVKML